MNGEMGQIEVVTSEVSLRDGTEAARTIRFGGELLATYTLGNREETLYKMEDGGFLVYTCVKPPVGPIYRKLSHDVGRKRGYTAGEVGRWHPELGTALGVPSQLEQKRPGTLTIYKTWSDTRPPQGRIVIGGGDAVTRTRKVMLRLYAHDQIGSGVAQMRIRNGGGDPWSDWEPYAATTRWELSGGEGEKAVYVQFMDRAGNRSDPVKGTITFRPGAT